MQPKLQKLMALLFQRCNVFPKTFTFLLALSLQVANPAFAQENQQNGDDNASGLGRPIPEPNSFDEQALEELEAFEIALSNYESEIQDYRDTIAGVVSVEYNYRRIQLNEAYDNEINTLRIEERIRRNSAIADFQNFLREYPEDPEYTPDVMFRLAELFYEKAVDDYYIADEEYEALFQRYDYGIIPDEPPEPEKDFHQTIEIFSSLIERFPQYRQIDGAYYLTAICYNEMNELEQGQETFLTLLQHFPESEFAQEAYLRVGEDLFDDGNFNEALAAYQRAYDFKDNPEFGITNWHDKILFKLGWSHYMLSHFHDAIMSFEELLAFYEEENQGASALREEALQYFAISLVEEDWDIIDDLDLEFDDDPDSLPVSPPVSPPVIENPDPGFIMPRIHVYLGEEDPWTQEVLDRVVGMLHENQRLEHEIAFYRYLLERYPMDPGNPQRHERMIEAMARDYGDQIIDERQNMVEVYSRGSDWYDFQERQGNLEALAYADSLARDGLIDVAANYYQTAERMLEHAKTIDCQNEANFLEGEDQQACFQRRENEFEDAKIRFLGAARLFEQFLVDFPYDDEAYEKRFFFAQSLYYAEEYLLAADQYILVRDSRENDQLQEMAGFFAILSYKKEIIGEVEAGHLSMRALPVNYRTELQQQREEELAQNELANQEVEDEEGNDDRRGVAQPGIQVETVPELSLLYVGAVDAYVQADLNREDDPSRQGSYAYSAAEIFYEFKHYADARERFIYVMDHYCGQEITGYAGTFLIESYRLEEDFENMQLFADNVTRRMESGCVMLEEGRMAEFEHSLEMFTMGAVAEQAEGYLNEGEYRLAAQTYIQLANDYPEEDFAPLGLYNGGVTYEDNLREYELAMRQFERLILEYPESEHIDDALVRIAVNSQKFFDFERAIATFMILYERGYSNSEQVEYPIINAAKLLQYSQQYEASADAFMVFVEEHPNTPDAPVFLFTAAGLYGQAGNYDRMFELYSDFRDEYGNGTSELIDIDAAVIVSLQTEAEYRAEHGETRSAERLNERILDEYNRRQPENPGAKAAAAEIIYQQAMDVFNEWNSITFGESLSSQQEAIADRRAGIEGVTNAFSVVVDYGVADWSICAGYQVGYVYKAMSETLMSLPMPDFHGDMNAEDEYIIMLEDYANQYEDVAIERWRDFAYPLIVQFSVQNECTINTMRELNRFSEAEYPVFSEEIRTRSVDLFSPQIMTFPEGEEEELDLTTDEQNTNLPADSEQSEENSDSTDEPFSEEQPAENTDSTEDPFSEEDQE